MRPHLVVVAVAQALVAPRARVGRVRPRVFGRLPEPDPADVAAVYGGGAGDGAAVGARNCSAVPGAGLEEHLYAFNRGMIDAAKGAIDAAYAGRDYARFYVLETVARVPYFAYVSVLHLRESFGARDPDHVARMRVHYAEADNELHHLLVMEALGGNASAVDRGVASTLAFAYYWYVCAVYAASPRLAYHLSELIEDHAYATYDAFLADHGDALRREPPPPVAVAYYDGDTALADLAVAAAGRPPPPPRPKLASLYDVFVRIRDDERDHWTTLTGLVQFNALRGPDGTVAAPTRPCVIDEGACRVADDDDDDECLVADDVRPDARLAPASR